MFMLASIVVLGCARWLFTCRCDGGPGSASACQDIIVLGKVWSAKLSDGLLRYGYIEGLLKGLPAIRVFDRYTVGLIGDAIHSAGLA